eukprot:s1324_g6.t1
MRYSKYVKKPLETSGNSACAAATILAQNQPASPAGWRRCFRLELINGFGSGGLKLLPGRILQATEALCCTMRAMRSWSCSPCQLALHPAAPQSRRSVGLQQFAQDELVWRLSTGRLPCTSLHSCVLDPWTPV